MFFSAVNEVAVNFVRNDENPVVFQNNVGNRGEFLAGVNRAGGVVRRVQNQQLRSRRNRLFQFCGGHFVAVFGLGFHKNAFRAAILRKFGISHPVRRRNDNFVALFRERGDGVI